MSAYIEIKTAWRAAGGHPEITPTADRLLASLRVLARMRESADNVAIENDKLQTRASALRDVADDLRALVLGALSYAARLEDEEGESASSELLQCMGLPRERAETFQSWWSVVQLAAHPLQVGQLILSTEGERDCGGEPEEERFTGSVAVGQIVSVDNYVEQGWSYAVVFANGTSVNLDEADLQDADAYAVAAAPFIAPEGV